MSYRLFCYPNFILILIEGFRSPNGGGAGGRGGLIGPTGGGGDAACDPGFIVSTEAKNLVCFAASEDGGAGLVLGAIDPGREAPQKPDGKRNNTDEETFSVSS